MVIGPAIRIGQIVYKIFTYQNKTIKNVYKDTPNWMSKGVEHGAGIGTLTGGIIEYFKSEEQDGNLIGLPQAGKQGRNNRFRKTRSSLFKSSRGRCNPKTGRNCFGKKYRRYR